tara:strand:+ start:514 stop:1428 length:915 start_codon:yes stop_codon:yes gene_type:complete
MSCIKCDKVKTSFDKQFTTSGLVHFNNRPLANYKHSEAPPDTLYFNNTNYNGVSDGTDPNAFRARPIKHWRKSLFSSTSHKSRSIRSTGMIGVLDKPGNVNYLDQNRCKSCDINNPNINVIEYNIKRNNDQKENVCNGCNVNVIKRASTFLDKNYSTTTAEYLHKKCRTYNQKSSGINYDNTTKEYYSNCSCPEYSYNTFKKKSDDCVSNCRKVYYKPSNTKFSTQGGVSSGTRIARLKYDTVTKNGSSFRASYNNNGAVAGATYNGSSERPFFSKLKEQKFALFKRTGGKMNIKYTNNAKNCC